MNTHFQDISNVFIVDAHTDNNIIVFYLPGANVICITSPVCKHCMVWLLNHVELLATSEGKKEVKD